MVPSLNSLQQANDRQLHTYLLYVIDWKTPALLSHFFVLSLSNLLYLQGQHVQRYNPPFQSLLVILLATLFLFEKWLINFVFNSRISLSLWTLIFNCASHSLKIVFFAYTNNLLKQDFHLQVLQLQLHNSLLLHTHLAY